MSDNNDIFARLITANHVLHKHGVLTEFGSVSLRNPADSTSFFSSAMPAMLISDRSDISEWNVRDGSLRLDPSSQTGPPRYDPEELASEHFIHSCMYDRFPGVQSVVHSQSKESLVYGLCDAGGSLLNPVTNRAGFIGDFTPIFDPVRRNRNPITGGDHNNLFIDSQVMGDSMAMRCNNNQNEYNGATMLPACSIIMLRGNGMVVWADSLDEAVYRAIQVQRNARVQTEAMLQRSHSDLELVYMSPEEISVAKRMVPRPTIRIICMAWAAEVHSSGLYRNGVLGI